MGDATALPRHGGRFNLWVCDDRHQNSTTRPRLYGRPNGVHWRGAEDQPQRAHDHTIVTSPLTGICAPVRLWQVVVRSHRSCVVPLTRRNASTDSRLAPAGTVHSHVERNAQVHLKAAAVSTPLLFFARFFVRLLAM